MFSPKTSISSFYEATVSGLAMLHPRAEDWGEYEKRRSQEKCKKTGELQQGQAGWEIPGRRGRVRSWAEQNEGMEQL
ncbi:hypothetical protein F7725_018729 [Dissostichus mawsoni]|uniref:Uncharacterized protein n=1 Tax=Dissostichus mawsoni TaxID=36200 RepID=A0A7J5XSE1_DISMA|nr:hypothetical protein F7725_018729 [Dissostichus mawsoni]